MEGLRMYGGFEDEGVDKGVNNDDGRWTDHISIQRKYFNEIVSMRDEYQQMFEEFFEKFKEKVKRENELEKKLDEEKLRVKELHDKNQQNEENIAELTRQLIVKDKENNSITSEESQVKINSLEEKCQEKNEEIEKLSSNLEESEKLIEMLVKKGDILQDELNVANEKLKSYEEKCEDLEQSNKLANGRINTLRIARDVYAKQVQMLKNKLSMSGITNVIECNEKTSNEFVVYREQIKNYEASQQSYENEIKNMKEERDKLVADLKLLGQANQDKDEDMEKLKFRSQKLSEELKSQRLTNESLRNEKLTMKNEIIKSNSTLKSLQETNKNLEHKTWNMVDSFDDIYRYIQEAKRNIVGKKKYFGKCFTSNRFLLDHLQSIEDITNIYE